MLHTEIVVTNQRTARKWTNYPKACYSTERPSAPSVATPVAASWLTLATHVQAKTVGHGSLRRLPPSRSWRSSARSPLRSSTTTRSNMGHQTAAVTKALRLVAGGLTPYAAAKKVGIALSTIY